jgi:HK97 family phage major capsid protein
MPKTLAESSVEDILKGMTDEQKKGIMAILGKPEAEQVKAIDAIIADSNELKTKFTEAEKEIAALKADVLKLDSALTEKKLPAEQQPKNDFGFTSFGDFAKAVSRENRGVDDRLIKHQNYQKEKRAKAAGDGMQVWDDSEGGFTIPEQFIPTLLKFDPNLINLAGRSFQFDMSSPIAHIPTIVSTTHAGGAVYGAIVSYFKSEEALLTESKPVFGEITLTANKLTTLAYVTDEMMTFSPSSLSSLLEPMFQNAIQWKLDQKIINGTGAGEPRGLLASACKIANTRDTAAHIMGVDIPAMWSRMPMNLKGDAIWLISPNAVPDLMTANIVIGLGGQLVYMPPGGFSQAPYGTIYGKPVIETEHCPALGTAGDLILVNLKQYLFGRAVSASGSGMVASIHLKFDYAQTAFRILMYVDGQCWWSSALTPANSGATLSPIVVLT